MLIKVNAFMVEYVAAYLNCVYGSCRVGVILIAI